MDIGKVFRGETYADIFSEIRSYMLENGERVLSRIGGTCELINPTIILENPKQNMFYSPKRKFNLPFACAEFVMLFSKYNGVDVISYFNKKMYDYSDDGYTLNSAYGQYICPNIEGVASTICNHMETRQAVINIYDSSFLNIPTKDVPCTLALNFFVRDKKLNLTVYMRSNDLFWGLQYDIFSFTMLQQTMANELGLECGVYIHCPTSLHVYDYHYELLQGLTDIMPCGMESQFNINQAKETAGELMDMARKGAGGFTHDCDVTRVLTNKTKYESYKKWKSFKEMRVPEYAPVAADISWYKDGWAE